jgi:hypothetical protein
VDKTTLEVVSMSKVDDRDVRTRVEVGMIVPPDTPVGIGVVALLTV